MRSCTPGSALCCSLGFRIALHVLGGNAPSAGHPHKVFYHFTATNESGCCRNKGIAGRNIATVGTLAHVLVRADAMETATDVRIVYGAQRFFLTIYYFQTMDVQLAKFLAYHLSQRIHLCLIDIGDTEGCGIHLVGSSHTRDYGNVQFVTTPNKFEFGRHRVYTVHYIVKVRKVYFVCILGYVEHLVFVYDAAFVDVMHTLFTHIDFVLAHTAQGGNHLTVDIGKAHAVIVENVQFANTAACQHLHYVSTDTTDTENSHSTTRKGVDGCLPHEQLGTGKLVLHTFCYLVIRCKGTAFFCSNSP